MTDYKGLKIPEKITIVEQELRTGTVGINPKGYVILADDKKALASAHSWADWTEEFTYNKQTKTYVEIPPIKHIGVEHTYDNGTFKLLIKEAAEKSWSQGGRLSFWTCTVKCPDGKQFDVGINSEYLCETILHNTIKNGEVQDNVYLGKVKGNTLAVSKSQPSYKQAMNDEVKRTEAKTATYKAGDVVSTLCNKEIYLGTWYQKFSVIKQQTYTSYLFTPVFEYIVTLYKKPAPIHAFQGISYDNGAPYQNTWLTLYKQKPKRTVTEQTFDVSKEFDSMMKSLDKQCEPDHQWDYSKDYHLSGSIVDATNSALKRLMFTQNSSETIDLQTLKETFKKFAPIYYYDHYKVLFQDEQGEILGKYEQ